MRFISANGTAQTINTLISNGAIRFCFGAAEKNDALSKLSPETVSRAKKSAWTRPHSFNAAGKDIPLAASKNLTRKTERNNA
jgi:hypothetical protein